MHQIANRVIVHLHDVANLVVLALFQIVECDGLTLATCQMIHQMSHLCRLHQFAFCVQVVVFHILGSTSIGVTLYLAIVREGVATKLVEQAILQRNNEVGIEIVNSMFFVALGVHLNKHVVDAVFQQFLVLGQLCIL